MEKNINISNSQIVIDQQQINIKKNYPSEWGFHLSFTLDRHSTGGMLAYKTFLDQQYVLERARQKLGQG